MAEENFDVAVIGSGPGGYIAALRAAELGLKTVCIEKDKTFGGTCLNVGCIPSKALLQSTEYYELLKEGGHRHGISAKGLDVDFTKMQQRKNEIVSGLVGGIAGLFKRAGVVTKQGTAKFVNPSAVSVEGEGASEIVNARHFILATGSAPIGLPFLPFDEKVILSSTGALSLAAPPKKMIVVGGGVIGVELASVYRRLGTEVTIVEMLDRICTPMDLGMSKMLLQLLKKQGLEFHLSSKVLKGKLVDSQAELTVEREGGAVTLSADAVLVAVGRRPYSFGLGLEEIGVSLNSKGLVDVDGNFKTNHKQIYAIGDLIEGPMLAHRASIEGAAVADLIAGRKTHVNYMTIPNIVYTHPEFAGVGLTEQEAQAKGLSVKLGSASFKASGRARCIGYSEGMVKVIAEAKSRRLIGVHILGPQASELIAEAGVAIDRAATLDDMARLCHAHPTLSETFHEAVLSAGH